MIVRVEGVEFAYRSEPAIHDVGFEVESGDILAVMGPNGVGKSTLLKCLNRILEPRLGSVMIDGEDIRSMSRKEVAKRVGFVAQRADAPRITVYDLVLLGRVPRIGWSASREDHRATVGALERLGLGDLALRRADELSGGEFQLVQIARALAQEPRILVLDEPTSSLDLSNQHRLMATIERVATSTSVAVVMTIHDLNLALRYAKKIILMRGGTIYAAGGVDIVTADAVRAVYGIDARVGRIDGHPFVVPR